MNLFAITSLFCAISCLILAFIALIFKKTKLHLILLFFNIVVTFWGFGSFLAGIATSGPKALFGWQVAHLGGFFIGTFFYNLVCIFCEIKRKKLLYFAYSQAIFFNFLNFGTNLLFNKTRFVFGIYYNEVTLPLFFGILSYISLVILSYYELIRFINQAKGYKRTQALYILFGFMFGFIGGTSTFLPEFKIDIIYPFGNIGIALYCVIVTYAILRHHLMDIEVVIKKTVVFASLLTIVFGIFVGVTFLLQQLVMGGRLLGGAVSCLIIILAYRPIENFLVNITNKYLFQKKYDYKHLIRQFMDELKTMVLNVNDIARSTLDFLQTTIHPECSAIFLSNRFTNVYDIIASDDFKNKDYKIDNDSFVVKKLNESGLSLNINDNNNLQGELKSAKIEILVPLFIHKELLGVLALGKKKSDEEYTEEDVEALTDLSGALAITMNNAQLFGEKADDEKRALVGTLATGINHEISNPLNTITVKLEGLRIMANMGLLAKKSKEEILDEVSNIAEVCNICARRIAEITMQIAEFAKPEKNIVLDKVNVCEAIDETITFLKHGMIIEGDKIEKKFSGESIYALADKGQLQQVIFNLLKNASHVIDKERGKIIVSVDKNGDDKVTIKITDNGPGIPQNVLNKLFTPFFTTKEPGKGTGLGLALVKIMTERNDGIIKVESEEGKGTTFTLVFKGER